VTRTIADRLGVTIFLSLMSTVLVLGLGVLLGASPLSTAARDSTGGWSMFGSRYQLTGLTSPAFSFSISSVPCCTGSRSSVRDGFLDRAWHLTLPALALAISVWHSHQITRAQ